LRRQHGLDFAEVFYYMPPDSTFTGITNPQEIVRYIAENAKLLEQYDSPCDKIKRPM